MRAERSYAVPSDVVPLQDAEHDDCAETLALVARTATAVVRTLRAMLRVCLRVGAVN